MYLEDFTKEELIFLIFAYEDFVTTVKPIDMEVFIGEFLYKYSIDVELDLKEHFEAIRNSNEYTGEQKKFMVDRLETLHSVQKKVHKASH